MIQLSTQWAGMSAAYIEGALLAANISPKPLLPELWLHELVKKEGDENNISEIDPEDRSVILSHLEKQYIALMQNAYELPKELKFDKEATSIHQTFSEGFLALWLYVEPAWQNVTMTEGTRRMLSGLVTSLLLMNDEKGTLLQMQEAGLTQLPEPHALYCQFNMMVNEVAQAASEKIIGAKTRAVNPFKKVGRNDICLCGSLLKFKKCCGKS